MNRIYHPYWKWEDHKNGFYENCSGKEKELKKQSVLNMFNSEKLTKEYMNRVIEEWQYSCEHNLTNESMNKIAYIGQAACCLYDKVPNLITMYAWKFLKPEIRERSDKIAKKTINKWMQNRKLKNTSNLGKRKDMKTEYQMKLHLN
jgi:23S rRNA A1618 N6-methylase RlmF